MTTFCVYLFFSGEACVFFSLSLSLVCNNRGEVWAQVYWRIELALILCTKFRMFMAGVYRGTA